MVNPMSQSSRSSHKWFPWLICGLGAMFYTYEYFLRIAPNVMTTQLMTWFKISAGSFGNLVAFYYYAYAPAQLLVGVLMDHYGPRRLLSIACLICAVGSYLFASSHNLIIVGFGRFLMGFGSAFAFVGVLKLATIWLPPERFAMVSGLTSALGTVGAMFGEIGLTVLVEDIGWEKTMVLAAALGVILAIILLLFIRDGSREAEELDERDALDFKSILLSLWKILTNPQIWINGGIGCLLYLPTTAFAELWGNPFFQSVYGFRAEDSALAISAMFLGFTIGAPINGYISDKIRRRCLPMMFGGAAATVLFLVIIYVPGLPRSLVCTLLFFASASYSAQVIVFAVGRESSPINAAGTAIAVTNGMVMLGGVFFQPIIGYMLDYRWNGVMVNGVPHYSASDYRYAMLVIPIALILSVVLAALLKETHGKLVIDNKD